MLIRETYPLLQASGLNFVGNVEGKDIGRGLANVVVTDGLTGNVIVKLTEGVVSFLAKLLKREFTAGLRNKLALLLMIPGLILALPGLVLLYPTARRVLEAGGLAGGRRGAPARSQRRGRDRPRPQRCEGHSEHDPHGREERAARPGRSHLGGVWPGRRLEIELTVAARFAQAGRRHGNRRTDPGRQQRSGNLGILRRRTIRGGTGHRVRHDRVPGAHRRRGEGLRSAGAHPAQGSAPHGPLHAVGDCVRAPGRRRCRAGLGARGSRASGGRAGHGHRGRGAAGRADSEVGRGKASSRSLPTSRSSACATCRPFTSAWSMAAWGLSPRW